MLLTRLTFQISSIAILLLGLGWIYVSKTNPTVVSTNLNEAAKKGFIAPDFEGQTLSGETVRLSDFRGKPVILNIWASWCSPCREEMPALQRIHTDYQERGLIVLGLHMTAQDSREAASNFVEEYDLTFLVPLDLNGDISRLYRVLALPTTYFIASDGVIQDIITGGPIAEAVFRAQVEDLLQRNP